MPLNEIISAYADVHTFVQSTRSDVGVAVSISLARDLLAAHARLGLAAARGDACWTAGLEHASFVRAGAPLAVSGACASLTPAGVAFAGFADAEPVLALVPWAALDRLVLLGAVAPDGVGGGRDAAGAVAALRAALSGPVAAAPDRLAAWYGATAAPRLMMRLLAAVDPAGARAVARRVTATLSGARVLLGLDEAAVVAIHNAANAVALVAAGERVVGVRGTEEAVDIYLAFADALVDPPARLAALTRDAYGVDAVHATLATALGLPPDAA